MVRDIEFALGQRLERRTVPGFDVVNVEMPAAAAIAAQRRIRSSANVAALSASELQSPQKPTGRSKAAPA